MDSSQLNSTTLDNSHSLDFSTESLNKLEEVLSSDHVKQLLIGSKGFEQLAASLLQTNDHLSSIAKSSQTNGHSSSSSHSFSTNNSTSVHVDSVPESFDLVDALDSLVTQLSNSSSSSVSSSSSFSNSNHHQYNKSTFADEFSEQFNLTNSNNMMESIFCEHSYSRPILLDDHLLSSTELVSSEPIEEITVTSESPSSIETSSPSYSVQIETNKSQPSNSETNLIPFQSSSSILSPTSLPQSSSSSTSSSTSSNSISTEMLSQSSIAPSPLPANPLTPQRRSKRQMERHERCELERIKAENQELLKKEKEQSELRKQAEELSAQDNSPDCSSKTPNTPQKKADLTVNTKENGSAKSTPTRTRTSSLPQNKSEVESPVVISSKRRRSSTSLINDQPKEKSIATSSTEETELKASSSSEDDNEVGDDDSGEDWGSDDDPEKLWCTCRQPHNNRFMICCDQCEDWFHGTCVGVTRAQGALYEKESRKWFCSKCRELQAEERRITSSLSSKRNRVEPAKRTARSKIIKEKQSFSNETAKTVAGKSPSLKEEQESKDKVIAKTPIVSEEKKQEQALKDLIKHKKLEISKKLSSLKSTEVEKPRKISRNDSTESNHKPDSTVTLLKEKSSTPEMTKEAKSKETEKSTKTPEITKSNKKDEKQKKKKEAEIDPSFNDLFKAEPLTIQKKPPSASTSGHSPKKNGSHENGTCANVDCFKPIAAINGKSPSVFCSESCIDKYAEHMIRLSRSRHEQTEKHDKDNKESHAHRLTVIDKKTGRYLSGNNAIHESKVVAYLKSNPSYEIVLPQIKRLSTSSVGREEKRRSSTGSASGISSNGNSTSSAAKPPETNTEALRANAKKTLRKTLQTRVEQCKDVQLERNAIKEIANQIEEELFNFFKQVGSKYKTRYRSLVFNLGDSKNQGLYRRVLSGKLKPDKLVRMTPEELASSELAKWRERENKHSIEMLKRDAEQQAKQLIVKKTHKGEELIETKVQLPTFDEPLLSNESDEKRRSSVGQLKSSSDKPNNPLDLLFKDTTSEHSQHLFDLHCKICSSKGKDDVEPRKRSSSSSNGKNDRNELSPNSNEPKRVRVELDEPTSRILKEATRIVDEEVKKESIRSGETKDCKSNDSEVKEVATKPLSNSFAVTSTTSSSRSTSCWNGMIQMQDFTKFAAFAYRVCGNYEPQDILDTATICGRIAHEQVFDYLKKLKYSNRTEITVLRLVPANLGEKKAYEQLFSYLHYRKRFSVIENHGPNVKDFYLLTLAKDQSPPELLTSLNGFEIESKHHRPNLLLIVLVRYVQSSDQRISSSEHVDELLKSKSHFKRSKVEKSGRSSSLQERSYTPPPPLSLPSSQMNERESNDNGSYTPPLHSDDFDSSNKEHGQPHKNEDEEEEEPYDPEEAVSVLVNSSTKTKQLAIETSTEVLDVRGANSSDSSRSIEDQKKLLDDLTSKVEESRKQLELQRKAAENAFSIAQGGTFSFDSNAIPGLDGEFSSMDYSKPTQTSSTGYGNIISMGFEDRIVKQFGNVESSSDLNLLPETTLKQTVEPVEPEPMELDDDDEDQTNTILEVNNTVVPGDSVTSDPRLRNKSKSSLSLLPDSELIAKAQLQLESMNEMQSNSNDIHSNSSQPKIKFRIERKEASSFNLFSRTLNSSSK